MTTGTSSARKSGGARTEHSSGGRAFRGTARRREFPRMSQDLRSFVAAYARAHPDEVVRVAEPVSLAYDVMALVLEYERRHRFPILIFEKVDPSADERGVTAK